MRSLNDNNTKKGDLNLNKAFNCFLIENLQLMEINSLASAQFIWSEKQYN